MLGFWEAGSRKVVFVQVEARDKNVLVLHNILLKPLPHYVSMYSHRLRVTLRGNVLTSACSVSLLCPVKILNLFAHACDAPPNQLQSQMDSIKSFSPWGSKLPAENGRFNSQGALLPACALESILFQARALVATSFAPPEPSIRPQYY